MVDEEGKKKCVERPRNGNLPKLGVNHHFLCFQMLPKAKGKTYQNLSICDIKMSTQVQRERELKNDINGEQEIGAAAQQRMREIVGLSFG